MGSITHVTEGTEVQNYYEYDAWGNVTTQEEKVSNRFRFTGEQFDPITQQYYLRARYYNPVIARFTQEDTYHGDGLNLYTYCSNNPVYYVDPTGHGEEQATVMEKNRGDSGSESGNGTKGNGKASNGLAKEGLGKITGKEYKITQKGFDNVKKYLTEQGFIEDYENQAMLQRLENALASGEKITGADAVFYTHEIKETQLVASGIEQTGAHEMTLQFYEVSPFSVYHPDVIKMESVWWNKTWFDFWNIER